MVQYEMYFANEYTEEIVYDLVEVMGLYVEKKDIQVAIQEKNKYSLDNLLLLKGESGSICIDYSFTAFFIQNRIGREKLSELIT